MSLIYHKRYRMVRDLHRRSLPRVVLPPGYRLVGWRPDLLDEHARAKYESFRGEVDAAIFDCLAHRDTCAELMRQIVARAGFLPEATWLLQHGSARSRPQYCGAIQGVRTTPRGGGIQNVGVTAAHRGAGLGSALVAAALLGFRQAGARKVFLDVTAENRRAVLLYTRLGFRRVKTLYKAVEVACAVAGH